MEKRKRGRPTKYEEVKRGNLLAVCTEWLVDNFHTFDKETKIKVAIEIAKKGIVQRVEANVNYSAKTIMTIVQEAQKENNRITEHV